jgi:peptidase C39-like protein
MVLGRWASSDKHVRRTSVPGQSDALGRVDVDTWKAATSADSYQLQVRLMRRSGASSASPSVSFLGAVASQLPSSVPAVSTAGVGRGITLAVPAYSQMVHRGEFSQYGGGGEAWCSPTSTAMVLGYYGRLPSPGSYAWVGSRTDPWVDEVARRTYDAAYEGTGNWPFNTAYAASRGLHAFVTRLRSLAEAESLVAAGIPVIASVSFSSGALYGAPISSTAGHLLVIVGFTATGDVVVNDPAASSAAGVRRTYDRAQFEKAWLGGSGGTAYVIHDDAHPLPASSGNW